MSLQNILHPFESYDGYKDLLKSFDHGKKVIEVHGVTDMQKSLLSAALSRDTERSCIIITHDDKLLRKIYDDISFLEPCLAVFFPSSEMIYHKIDAKSSEDRMDRIKAISRIKNGERLIICTTVEALLMTMGDPNYFYSFFVHISLGDTISIERFTEYFLSAGYERVDMIEGRGQYSIRGGIIDFYSPKDDHPIRIELFGDEVDSIRYFDLFTQRSIKKLERTELCPCREFLVSKDDFPKGKGNIKKALEKRIKSLKNNKEIQEVLIERFSEDIEKIEQGLYFEGIERYSPFFYDRFYNILDYLEDYIVIIDDPNRVRQRCDGIRKEFIEHFKHLLEKGEVLPEQFNTQFSYDEALIKLKRNNILCYNNLLKRMQDFQPVNIISFLSRSMQAFHGKLSLLIDEIKVLKRRRYKVLIVVRSEERGKRLCEDLWDEGVEALYQDGLNSELEEGQVVVIPGVLSGGFDFSAIRYAIITDIEVLGATKKRPARKKRRSSKFFGDLETKDYVVHEHHGIGQYMGIERLKVNNIERDYLNIRYAGNDKLYIPTDQLDLIQKYVGGDKSPRVNRLAGTEWAKTKARAKKAIKDMALDLLKLYAERQKLKGFAFSADNRWQKEFEDLFPYQETADQIESIEEIKEDMQKDKVMDRLLCGDVGYGKTEVALRAAFKAIMDGKQVAILVPTTILAQQHYHTCIDRFGSFPITVELLSRFRKTAEQNKVIEGLKKGIIDLVIGTHRLIQGDVGFKDLGLLVIDEEQRFGVAHKERIKQIKQNVDVLTLTATPIPRTLHMSLTGVRDISIIEEPPEERYPVQTYVMEFNEEIIREAMLRELNRGGQVYFLYNRVRTIEKIAKKLRLLVPEARILIGHGQMEEKRLERTMIDFYNGDGDVLVCTTIIESGLDIPNVNTIIVCDADRLGLAQLYQLRGRVGRSNRLAYAYLTYERDKVLTEIAEKRLKAIKEFTEFGSGFKIAMRDLEIRGAGNLLGREQHGHMEAIGYDLYTKLLEGTVRELTGRTIEEKMDASIEIDISAFIPRSYIEDENQRIEIYRKIASIDDKEYLYDVEEEIEDRFGDIPISVRNLLKVSYIKQLSTRLNIISIAQKKDGFLLKFKNDRYINPEMIITIMDKYKERLSFTASEQPFFKFKADTSEIDGSLDDLIFLLENLQKNNKDENLGRGK